MPAEMLGEKTPFDIGQSARRKVDYQDEPLVLLEGSSATAADLMGKTRRRGA
jgi:hypothetical protein